MKKIDITALLIHIIAAELVGSSFGSVCRRIHRSLCNYKTAAAFTAASGFPDSVDYSLRAHGKLPLILSLRRKQVRENSISLSDFTPFSLRSISCGVSFSSALKPFSSPH